MITNSTQVSLTQKALKDFQKNLSAVSLSLCQRESTTFDEFLSFFLNNFSYPEPVFEKFDEKKNILYKDMFSSLLVSLKDVFEDKDIRWWDIFGEVYMQLSRKDKSLGQFFTPHNLCSCLQELVMSQGVEDNEVVTDPCCGSGRMLLAAKAQADKEQKKIRLVAADLDQICVKMTLCNFLLHGVEGCVKRMDSLSDEVFACYLTLTPYTLVPDGNGGETYFPVPLVVKADNTNKNIAI